MSPPNIDTLIHARIESFKAVFAASDAAGVAEFYTDDAMLLPPGCDMVQGKESVQAFWQEGMNMGIKNIMLDVLEVEQHGDTAIEISNYIMSGSDNQIIDRGKGVMIWKCEGGQWKMHRDTWNTSIS